jgi:hypothetical protein
MSTQPVSPTGLELMHDPKQLAARLKSQKAAAGAEELEAGLFATVLDKMEKNLSIEDEENSDAGHEAWGAIGVRAVSQALAQRHVLGFAQMIQHALGVDTGTIAPTTGKAADQAATEKRGS